MPWRRIVSRDSCRLGTPPPSLPTTTVVTPCIRNAAFSFPSSSSKSPSAWVCGSIKPGATSRPVASIVVVASASADASTLTIRSPTTPTFVTRAGAPLPSTTFPLSRSTSYCSATVSASSDPPPQAASTISKPRVADSVLQRSVSVFMAPRLAARCGRAETHSIIARRRRFWRSHRRASSQECRVRYSDTDPR